MTWNIVCTFNSCPCICVHRIKPPLFDIVFGQVHLLIVIDKSVDKADILAGVTKRFEHEFASLKVKWIPSHVIGADEFYVINSGECERIVSAFEVVGFDRFIA